VNKIDQEIEKEARAHKGCRAIQEEDLRSIVNATHSEVLYRYLFSTTANTARTQRHEAVSSAHKIQSPCDGQQERNWKYYLYERNFSHGLKKNRKRI
jgi:hypothetical protein